jgi:hypothetical protein
VVGIITLEDIVEEILGAEIEDETDALEYDVATMVRDPELARLRTMGTARVDTDGLSSEEIHSIGIFLFTNVPQVQRMFREDMSGLEKLVRTGVVVSMTRKALPGEKPHHEDYLYHRGKMSTTCALILEGSVEVIYEGETESAGGLVATAGKIKTKGPWSVIAVEALEAAEGTYLSPFDAVVRSDTVRFLRLSSHSDVDELLEGAGTPRDKAGGIGASFRLRARSRSVRNLKTGAGKAMSAASSASGNQPVRHPEPGVTDWAEAISYSIAPFRPHTHSSHGIAGDVSPGPETVSPMHATDPAPAPAYSPPHAPPQPGEKAPFSPQGKGAPMLSPVRGGDAAPTKPKSSAKPKQVPVKGRETSTAGEYTMLPDPVYSLTACLTFCCCVVFQTCMALRKTKQPATRCCSPATTAPCNQPTPAAAAGR